MDFKEDGFMFTLALIVVAFVIVQAAFFLVRAIKRAKELGIEKSTIKNTIVSSGLFTIAPAIGIVATVLTLAAGLGYVLPWIRLTVIGNISYEVTAATNAIEVYGLSGGIANAITEKRGFCNGCVGYDARLNNALVAYSVFTQNCSEEDRQNSFQKFKMVLRYECSGVYRTYCRLCCKGYRR